MHTVLDRRRTSAPRQRISHIARWRRRTFAMLGCLVAIEGCQDATATRVSPPSDVRETRAAAGERGPIRIHYVCGNTFRLRYFGDDTTTVAWAVAASGAGAATAASDSGTVLLPARGSAPFFDTTFTTTLIGTVRLWHAGILVRTVANTQRACARPKLVVVMEHGVTERHGVHDSTYVVGTVVRYNFQLAKGFSNLLVTLDGSAAQTTGRLTMDQDHVLIATADSTPSLSAEERKLSTAMRKVIASGNPVAAYRALLADLESLADRPDFDDVARNAELAAFDPVDDSAALRRADAALAGRMFTVANGGALGVMAVAKRAVAATAGASKAVANTNVPSPILGRIRNLAAVTPPSTALRASSHPLRSVSALGTGPRDSLERTTIVYVNGIFTSPGTAAKTAVSVHRLMSQLPRFTDRAFSYTHFYNRSFPAQIQGTTATLSTCAARIATRLGMLGSNSVLQLLQRCIDPLIQRTLTSLDVVEALTQYSQLIHQSPPSAQDVTVLADTFHSLRSAGSHVIVIPHSQGTMMTHQAMSVLRARNGYDETRDSIGIAVVPLAAPVSTGWPFPVPRVKPVTVFGDVVADAGHNSWPRLLTPQSDALRALVAVQARLPGDPTLAAYVTLRQIKEGIALHAVDDSYLASPAAYVVRDSAASAYRELAAGEVVFSRTTDQLGVAATRNLTTLVTVYNQNDLGAHTSTPLYGRDLAWSSSTPSVVSVDGAGQAMGRSAGTARVWARSWGDSAAVSYTVPAPPAPSLTGYYTGYWAPLDYSRPFVKSPAWMRLSVTNGILTGTVGWTTAGAAFAAPIYTATLGPTGINGTFTLLGPDPEMIFNGADCIACTQVISVRVSGNSLYGTSYGLGMVNSREWVLNRVL